jgi:hypothetical protein
MAMNSSATSPLFLHLGELEEEDDDEGEELEFVGSGHAGLSPTAAILEPMRNRKLRSVRDLLPKHAEPQTLAPLKPPASACEASALHTPTLRLSAARPPRLSDTRA